MADNEPTAGLTEEQVSGIVAEYEDAGQQLAAALGTPNATLRELVGMAVDAIATAQRWAYSNGTSREEFVRSLDPTSRVGGFGG